MRDYSHLWKLATTFEMLVLREFPERKGQVGRPRFKVKGLFWMLVRMLHQGWTWREVPRRYGARSTLHDWFQKLVKRGVFHQLWEEVLNTKWSDSELVLFLQSIDTSTILAPGPWGNQAQRSHRYKPKRAIKLSILVDKEGAPLGVVIGGPNDHDSKLLDATLDSRPKKLKTSKIKGKSTLLGDKAYTGVECAEVAHGHGYNHIFIPRINESRQISKKEWGTVSKTRWVVERTFAWLKAKRKIAICHEHKLENYLAFVHLACSVIALGTGKG
jgi:transposase